MGKVSLNCKEIDSGKRLIWSLSNDCLWRHYMYTISVVKFHCLEVPLKSTGIRIFRGFFALYPSAAIFSYRLLSWICNSLCWIHLSLVNRQSFLRFRNCITDFQEKATTIKLTDTANNTHNYQKTSRTECLTDGFVYKTECCCRGCCSAASSRLEWGHLYGKTLQHNLYASF